MIPPKKNFIPSEKMQYALTLNLDRKIPYWDIKLRKFITVSHPMQYKEVTQKYVILLE